MIAWKAIAIAAVGVAVASNAWWIYATVDAGVTRMYQDQMHDEMTRKADLLGKLLVKSSGQLSRRDLVALARRVEPDAFIVDETAGVSVNGVAFQFADDRLTKVE